MRRLNSLSDPSLPTVRVVVLGGHNVGKSALIVRFLTKRFIGEYVSGTEITYLQEVNLAGNKVAAEICDALIKKESQDYLKKMSSNTEAYFIVYNVCCRKSFDYACTLAHEVKANHRNLSKDMDVPILLVGNKSDLNHFREVKLSEGESFAKTLSLCRFMETSAAESYPQVEKAFWLVFQLIRKKLQVSPTPSVSSCRHSRKKSISQVAQLIREHVRKQHSASNINKANSLDRGMSLSKYNSVTCDNNNNSTIFDQSSKQRTRRKGVINMQANATPFTNNTKPKLLSKCSSLSTLSENPLHQPLKNVTNSTGPLKAKARRHQRYNSVDGVSELWNNNDNTSSSPIAVMQMSLSSDDAFEFSDMSTNEEDAFLPDGDTASSFHHKADHSNGPVQQQNGRVRRPMALIKNPQAPHRSPKTSINKKGLQISIHSDGEIEDRELGEIDRIPPKSAPILRSTSANKFRYFPNAGVVENQEPLKQPWSSLSGTTVPISPLLDNGRRQSRVKSPREDKKSPHNLFKQFFKGTLYGPTSNKTAFGSVQSLHSQLSPASSETSLSTVPEYSWNALTSIDEQKTPEDGDFCEETGGIYFHASSSSLSSIVSNETTVSDALNSPSSAPCSPLVKKPIDSLGVKPRRLSFREAVGELMRNRKKSNNDCSKHTKERFL